MESATTLAIEKRATLALCIDRVKHREESSISQFVHGHDREGTHLQLTIFSDTSVSDVCFKEGEWYEIGPLRLNVYNGTFGAAPAGNCTVDPIDPSRQTAGIPDGSAGRDGVFKQLIASDGRVALDIETIKHVSDETMAAYRNEHGAVNPDHISLVCAALAYQPPATPQLPSPPIAERVVFADDESDREQACAIGEIAACLYAWDADTLLTYAGQWFDLPVLDALWEATSHAHPESSDRAMPWSFVIRDYYHADLSKPAMHTFGPVDLETAAIECDAAAKTVHWTAYAHDLDIPAWRRDFDATSDDGGSWDDPEQSTLVGTDVLYVGEKYLRGTDTAIQAMLADYAASDVRPLFQMAMDERFAGHPALALDYDWK
jgi:hypothetical protein